MSTKIYCSDFVLQIDQTRGYYMPPNKILKYKSIFRILMPEMQKDLFVHVPYIVTLQF